MATESKEWKKNARLLFLLKMIRKILKVTKNAASHTISHAWRRFSSEFKDQIAFEMCESNCQTLLACLDDVNIYIVIPIHIVLKCHVRSWSKVLKPLKFRSSSNHDVKCQNISKRAIAYIYIPALSFMLFTAIANEEFDSTDSFVYPR